ncbi:MAG TPA: hypothetical protein VLH59_14835 [Ignavibacteriaceae bacterium]|nr:hypothetical protein [Ignavibacteriaceae bacterium]
MLKPNEVEKNFQKEVRDNHFAANVLIGIFIYGFIISLIINYFSFGNIFAGNSVVNSTEILKWFSIVLILFGFYLIIAREKYLEGLRNKSFKIPTDTKKYRKHIIYIGIALVIIGSILLIIYLTR